MKNNYIIAFILNFVLLSIYGQNTIEIHPDNRVASIQLNATDYNNFIQGTYYEEDVTNELYQTFADDFDFIILVLNEPIIPSGISHGSNKFVSNAISNIGILEYSVASFFGSTTGKLKSVIRLNQIDYIENGPLLHELLHTFGNSLLPTEYAPDFGTSVNSLSAGKHWGLIGGSTKGQLGGFQQSSLVDLGNNTYTVDAFGNFANGGNSVPYNELELYLMGMLPLSNLNELDYFTDITSFVNNGNSTYTFEASNRVTINQQYITENIGVRNPDFSNSQKHFKALTVVVTDEPLTTTEWDLVNTQAQNFSIEGSNNNQTYNFWEATNGIGTFETGNLQISILDVEEFESDVDILIYPNPTTDFINIQANFDITSVEIYSLHGQKVLFVENKKRIDISSLSEGIYFLKVKTVNGEITKKIIKQ